MKTIHLYGLSAMLFLIGILLWMIRAALLYVAWFAIACGVTAAIIGLIRWYLPIAEKRHEHALAWQEIDLQQQLVDYVIANQGDFRRDANGTIEGKISHSTLRQVDPEPEPEQIETSSDIPTSVRYEDIKFSIPRDHVLVGVGEGGLVDTREKEVKGLIWIPGSSGAGKSNTTGLRVEEDYARGHQFLGIDPHFFKKDSLSNLVQPYMDKFIQPIAHTSEDILRILNLFIAEVEKRKAGGACWSLTLLYDEIGSQVSDKPEDDIERQIIEKTKKVIRLAGQETRGFDMNVIAISQDAAGLAFLRKRALLVLGHKTVMMSERELVCNGRTDIARGMDDWPVGRTVVYGVAIQGTLVRQQPRMNTRIVSSSPMTFPIVGNALEANGKANPVNMFPDWQLNEGLSEKKKNEDIGSGIRETIKRMHKHGMSHRDIALFVGLSGRKYDLYKQVCMEMSLLVEQEG